MTFTPVCRMRVSVRWMYTRLQSWRGQSCKRVYECESAEHAIELALEHAKMNDCILICGSLYLIGECEKILRGRPKATD